VGLPQTPDGSTSDPFGFSTLSAVAKLEDFGVYADSAFALARATFGHAESLEVTVQHMTGDHVVLVVDALSGRVVGMSMLRLTTAVESSPGELERRAGVAPDAAIAHLHGTVIDPDVRGLGLFRELNRRWFAPVLDRRIRFVSATTQNPKVERGLRSLLDELVAEGRIVGWTLDTEVRPGFYGQLLAAGQPDAAGTALGHLDRDAGDACSLLFSLRYEFEA
jgi:hypothetical protein